MHIDRLARRAAPAQPAGGALRTPDSRCARPALATPTTPHRRLHARAARVPAAPRDRAPMDLAVGDARSATRAPRRGACAARTTSSRSTRPTRPPSSSARLRELTRCPAPPADCRRTIVIESEASRARCSRRSRASRRRRCPVLLTGETGTGKEVVARLLHAWSAARRSAFVPINCAAIPNELMEAELFGYARGAFSGAVQRYDGQLMAAEGGTVFLDEIDDTPLETQIKLLRVLEDRVVSRLGENVWHEVDFRLLAATNRDLRRAHRGGAVRRRSLRAPGDRHHPAAAAARAARRSAGAGAPLHEALRARAEAPPTSHGHPPDALRALPGLSVARQHPRAAQRDLRDARLQAGGHRAPAVRSAEARCCSAPPLAEPEPTVDRAALSRKIAPGADEPAGTKSRRSSGSAIEEALQRTGGNAAQAARLLGEVGRGVARDPGGTLRAMMRRLGTGG